MDICSSSPLCWMLFSLLISYLTWTEAEEEVWLFCISAFWKPMTVFSAFDVQTQHELRGWSPPPPPPGWGCAQAALQTSASPRFHFNSFKIWTQACPLAGSVWIMRESSCSAWINAEEVLLITADIRGRCSAIDQLLCRSQSAEALSKWIKVCVCVAPQGLMKRRVQLGLGSMGRRRQSWTLLFLLFTSEWRRSRETWEKDADGCRHKHWLSLLSGRRWLLTERCWWWWGLSWWRGSSRWMQCEWWAVSVTDENFLSACRASGSRRRLIVVVSVFEA